MAGLVIQASGSLVEADILELSRFSLSWCWHLPGICHTGIGLGRMMVKELYLKLTLGMTERR